eukprot:6485588-Amphidinium_carterae.2
MSLQVPVRVPVRACHARRFEYCKHLQSRPLRQNGRVTLGGLGWHITRQHDVVTELVAEGLQQHSSELIEDLVRVRAYMQYASKTQREQVGPANVHCSFGRSRASGKMCQINYLSKNRGRKKGQLRQTDVRKFAMGSLRPSSK